MPLGGSSGSMLVLNSPTLPASGDAPTGQAPRSLSSFASTNDIAVKVIEFLLDKGYTGEVHPMVLFSILDHYLRRPENQKRVIGTLLGKVVANVVEVTNSFAVPHLEKNEEVAVGKDFNKQMLTLQQKVNARETIVGWYATSFDGVSIVDGSSLIHDFYTQECESPIHLVVDTALKVKVQLVSLEAERICIDRMVKGQEEPFVAADGLATVESRMTSLETSIQRLLVMLQQAESFVDSVVEGKVQTDPHLGRKLADTLAVVPRMRPEVFNRIFDDNLQDLLMVSYLSSLTKTQLAIAEKLAI